MTQELQQVLRIEKDKRELPIAAGQTAQEALDHYSLTYPELATATVGDAVPDAKQNKLIYKVTQTLGTKG